MKQNQAQWHPLMYPKSLTMGIAALLLLTMLMLLNTCTFSLTASAQANGTVSPLPVPTVSITDTIQVLTHSVGVAFLTSTNTFTSGNYTTLETYPVQEITQTSQLTDSNVVMTLSHAYTGVVHLELALLHAGESGKNKWRLIYTDSLPVSEPETWYDYLEYRVLQPSDTPTPTETTRILRGPAYTIAIPTISLSSTLSATSQPVDLAGWIDVLCPNDNTNICKKSIARLVFSVEVNGERWRVLYLSRHTQLGVISNPDGPNTCRSNRHSFYCRIISWFRRRR